MSNNPNIARRSYIFVKRLFDIIFAIISLVLLAPLFLVIALAIKLDSDGPVFFYQMRLGRHGVPFKYLKFRTMVKRADQSDTKPIFHLSEDPRITQVGRFLRITALDELPALLNVLYGEMSIVGPRAALPLEAEHYSELVQKRLELRPGITGYWQVYGRGGPFKNMVEMDLEYMEKLSLMLDLKILSRTIVIVLMGKGAY
jgi:lipopolysaccharide/colanic/teichoic acid biosynthesis glycosyltransferase